MNSNSYKTPILFIIFNRPDVTRVVFEEIRKLKPESLFIAADGPRDNKESDIQKCNETRQIVSEIDWKCSVEKKFSDVNLGCGAGPYSAIDWFFSYVDKGIILEDDCLPSYDFFYFCREMLERYKDNDRIMHISGNNFQYGRKRGNASYYFSTIPHSWGWATWKSAWNNYRFDSISEEQRKQIWDLQWWHTLGRHNGLAIAPNVNLVSNIGVGEDATHTKNNEDYMNLSREAINWPLKHPSKIIPHRLADDFSLKNHFNLKGLGIKKYKYFYELLMR